MWCIDEWCVDNVCTPPKRTCTPFILTYTTHSQHTHHPHPITHITPLSAQHQKCSVCWMMVLQQTYQPSHQIFGSWRLQSNDLWIMRGKVNCHYRFDHHFLFSPTYTNTHTSLTNHTCSHLHLPPQPHPHKPHPHKPQGSLPDMTATTDQYLQLSSIYRTKAESDTTAIEGHVKQILQALGRGKDEIGTRAIKMFCGNARNLR